MCWPEEENSFFLFILIFDKSNHCLFTIIQIIKLLSFQYSVLHLHHIWIGQSFSCHHLFTSIENSENPPVFCQGCIFRYFVFLNNVHNSPEISYPTAEVETSVTQTYQCVLAATQNKIIYTNLNTNLIV